MNNYIEYTSFLECIILLTKYKNLLRISSKTNDDDTTTFYQNEIEQVDKYINKWCRHEYVEDYFETKFDNMEKISYCKHCELNK